MILYLCCNACQKTAPYDAAARLNALQRIGHLRKLKAPDSPLIDPLFESQLNALECSNCRQKNGFSIVPRGSRSEEEDSFWGHGRLCEGCRRPISKERLEVLPSATLCVACAQAEECASACSSLSEESCPRCGEWMHWKTRPSSIRTHELVCRHCGSQRISYPARESSSSDPKRPFDINP